MGVITAAFWIWLVIRQPMVHGGRSSGKSWRNSIDDYRLLRPLNRCVLREYLSTQIEHEALQFSDPAKRAVLTLALKHFDAWRD